MSALVPAPLLFVLAVVGADAISTGEVALLVAGAIGTSLLGVLTYRTGTGRLYKQTAEERLERIKVLEQKIDLQAHEISSLQGRVQELSSRPDVTALVELIRSHDDRMEKHATLIQLGQERVVHVLSELIERIGDVRERPVGTV